MYFNFTSVFEGKTGLQYFQNGNASGRVYATFLSI